MANLVVDIENLADKFGDWVKDEFDSANVLYSKLTDLEKEGATYAYGVIAIVNQNLNSTGAVIIPLIQKVYPNLSLSVVQGFIDTLLTDVQAVEKDTPLTLEAALEALATYLKGFNGSTWEQISQALGNLLAVAFSPETPVQKFIGVAEIVYQSLVKPVIAAL